LVVGRDISWIHAARFCDLRAVANQSPLDGTAKKDGWTNNYVNGAKEAREAAIGLYRSYLATQKVRQPGAIQDVQHRLKQLRDNPNGSNTYDYFCGDYED
jgi:hypothetical protein